MSFLALKFQQKSKKPLQESSINLNNIIWVNELGWGAGEWMLSLMKLPKSIKEIFF